MARIEGARCVRQPTRWSASLERPGRVFESFSNLKGLGDEKRERRLGLVGKVRVKMKFSRKIVSAAGEIHPFTVVYK